MGMRKSIGGIKRESRCSAKSSELKKNFKNQPLHYTYNVYLCSDEEDLWLVCEVWVLNWDISIS